MANPYKKGKSKQHGRNKSASAKKRQLTGRKVSVFIETFGVYCSSPEEEGTGCVFAASGADKEGNVQKVCMLFHDQRQPDQDDKRGRAFRSQLCLSVYK